MTDLPIGTVQRMSVIRKIETGYVLSQNQEDILLHHNETDHQLDIDQKVDVFLYVDKNNQIVATTIIPSIQINAYDWAEVVEVIPKLGVFVHIGIAKDMLVSIDDLPLFEDVWPQAGDQLYVTLGKDQEGRLLALPATENDFMLMREFASDELMNKHVEGYVYHTSREGTAFFSNRGYRGFIHHTERYEEPRLGEFVTGRVVDVKEDGTINVSLKPLKQDRIDDDAKIILFYLENNGGVMPFSDKSDAADIREIFNVSKSAFKRAIGRLMKEKKVEQRNGQTYLLP